MTVAQVYHNTVSLTFCPLQSTVATHGLSKNLLNWTLNTEKREEEPTFDIKRNTKEHNAYVIVTDPTFLIFFYENRKSLKYSTYGNKELWCILHFFLKLKLKIRLKSTQICAHELLFYWLALTGLWCFIDFWLYGLFKIVRPKACNTFAQICWLQFYYVWRVLSICPF